MAPTVSIGIPTYNRAPLLLQSIRSVLQQTFQDFEIVVVDDCSPDNTAEAVQALGDPRIRYYRTSQNLRPPRSWNMCVQLARGEFFALLPDDDVYCPTFLAEMIAALRATPAAGFVNCGFYSVDSQLRPLRSKLASRSALHLQGEAALAWQIKRLDCPPVALLFRRAALLAGGLWRVDYWDDWALIVRLAYQQGFCFLPRVLACNRVHGSNLNMTLQQDGRDSVLFIVNQQLDIFSNALPTTPTLIALHAELNARLSQHVVLQALGTLRRGDWQRARTRFALARQLYALAGIDPAWIILALSLRWSSWRRRLECALAYRRRPLVDLDQRS